jgi:hypothetical protein
LPFDVPSPPMHPSAAFGVPPHRQTSPRIQPLS